MIKSKRKEAGFSLIEVLIAIVIITAGLVALSGALLVGVTLPQRSRQQEIAKQVANAIMESIIAAKESPRPGFTSFDGISYTTSPTAGRFVSGVTSMLTAGPDGVYGTCDDGQTGAFNAVCGSMGPQLLSLQVDPGSDGIYNTTAGNRSAQLLSFTREVIIRDLTPPPVTLKEIEVRVNYTTVTGARDTVTLICQLSNFPTL